MTGDHIKTRHIGLVSIFSLGVMLCAAGATHAVDSEAEIIARIKPVGVVCVAGENCDDGEAAVEADAPAPDAAAAEAPVTVASAGRSGAEIYNQSCVVCHGAGVAGAPVVGNKDAWAGRIAKGMDVLMANALNGINAMPPRGTCMNCSDEEMRAALQYMVDQSQ